MIMGPPPVDAAADRTESEIPPLLQHIRRDEIRRILLGQRQDGGIALDAPGKGPRRSDEIEPGEDLADLLPPNLAFDEETSHVLGPGGKGMVAGKERPPVVPGYGQELVVLGLGEEQNVEPKDFQPLGRFPEHAIDDEGHSWTGTRRTGRNGGSKVVDRGGLEPPTSALRTQRSPN